MPDKCKFCDTNDAEERLIVAGACRTCCRCALKFIMFDAGRGPNPITGEMRA